MKLLSFFIVIFRYHSIYLDCGRISYLKEAVGGRKSKALNFLFGPSSRVYRIFDKGIIGSFNSWCREEMNDERGILFTRKDPFAPRKR